FLPCVLVSRDTAGSFYAEIERTNGLPSALYPLNPAKVFPIPDGKGGIQSYQYRAGRDKVVLPTEDVLAWTTYHPTMPFEGLSPLSVAMGSIDADNAQTDYIRAFFNNAGVPSGLLTFKDRTISEAESQAIKA